MTIADKHREVIITSLEYSIHHIREYHQSLIAKTIDSKTRWAYDYEKHSIAPIQEALGAVRDAIKSKKK